MMIVWPGPAATHWRELQLDPKTKIGRPQQLFTGSPERPYPGV